MNEMATRKTALLTPVYHSSSIVYSNFVSSVLAIMVQNGFKPEKLYSDYLLCMCSFSMKYCAICIQEDWLCFKAFLKRNVVSSAI